MWFLVTERKRLTKRKRFRPFGSRVDFGRTGAASSKYSFMSNRSIVFARSQSIWSHASWATLEHDIESERAIILAEFRRKFPSERSWLDSREEFRCSHVMELLPG